MGRHVAPHWTHYPNSEPTSLCREATNINFIVFVLTRTGFLDRILTIKNSYKNRINSWQLKIHSITFRAAENIFPVTKNAPRIYI
jgi:hypothetical protein